MSKVCNVIISVISEIRDKLVSPSFIAWMADFLTALIEFLTSYVIILGGFLLFSTDVIRCSRFANFSSKGSEFLF